MDFVLTIDTEWDRLPGREGQVSTENLAALPDFHVLCRQFGVRPCYLTTQEAAESPLFTAFAETVLRNQEGEVGTHLHPWTTPPFTDDIVQARIRCPFPSEYSDEIFEAKLDTLQSLLSSRFGVQRTYRSGRWGLAWSHIPILARHGYLVDTSVTPFTTWTTVAGLRERAGPDFSRFGPMPFKWSDGGVLELPVTILLDGPPLWRGFHQRGRFAKWWARRRGVVPRWARPLPNAWSSLDRVLELASLADLPVFVMTMHSNELVPTTNPYFTSVSLVEELKTNLSSFFRRLNANGVRMTTPSEWAARTLAQASVN